MADMDRGLRGRGEALARWCSRSLLGVVPSDWARLSDEGGGGAGEEVGDESCESMDRSLRSEVLLALDSVLRERGLVVRGRPLDDEADDPVRVRRLGGTGDRGGPPDMMMFVKQNLY